MGCNSSQSTDVVNTSTTPTLQNPQTNEKSNLNLKATSNSNVRSEKNVQPVTLEDTKNNIISNLDKIERVDDIEQANKQSYNEETKQSDNELKESLPTESNTVTTEITTNIETDDKNNYNELTTNENLDGLEEHKKHLLTTSNELVINENLDGLETHKKHLLTTSNTDINN
jgi:hypothetical protein